MSCWLSYVEHQAIIQTNGDTLSIRHTQQNSSEVQQIFFQKNAFEHDICKMTVIFVQTSMC